MNKIYRTIWNAASGRWIAVQENARARGAKGGSDRSGVRSRSRLACGALAVAAAWGGGVRAGTVLDTDGATVISADICTGTTIGGSGLNYLAMGCNASASDTDSIAIGTSSVANGASALALGDHTYAIANGATALGGGATASGVQSVALGGDQVDALQDAAAKATGERAVAVGAATRAMGNNSIALGSTVTAAADNAVAIGSSAAVSGAGSVALGVKANGVGVNAAAIGAGSTASGDASTAIGNLATASGKNALAMGPSASASADNAIAMGQSAKGTVSGAIAIGQVAAAQGANSTAIGPAAVTSYADDIAIGNGAAASRAAFTGQSGNVALGASASAQGYRSIAIGYGAQTNTGSLYANASDIAIGQSAFAEGLNSVALGNNANVGTAGYDGNNVAVGSSSFAKASGAVAFGGSATAAASDATAIGATAYAGASGSTALGKASTASAANAIAIGNGANASVSNSVALGDGATTAAAVGTANGVIGGQTFTYAGATPTGVVSVGAAGAERQVTSVAAGRVTSTSTDAVNGSQLYATNTQVTTNTGAISTLQALSADAVRYDSSSPDSVTLGGAGTTTPIALHNVAAGAVSDASNDAVNGAQLFKLASSTASGLGGGSTVNSDGSITTPTYTVGGATFHNAGDAFTNIDGRTTANADAISNLQGQTADAVMYDSTAHDSVTLGGAGTSTPIALHNVANGTLDATSFDAVNGSQLYATNTQVTANTSAISNLQGQTADAVMYDSTAHDSVTLGGAGTSTPIALHSVANGAVAASSFDAINGSQLFGVSSALVDALGGSASLSADGSITLPTYRIGNTTYSNVGGALTNLDGRVTDISDAISSGTIGLVQQDATTHAITVGKDVSGREVDFTGTNGARLLTGVAAGNVDASSVDAVNGSQLFAIGNATASALGGGAKMNANGTMNGPNYAIGGNTYNTVGGALTDLDGRVSQNAQDISDIKGDVANAVSYDSSAHDSVTLGDGSTPVSLHNVAAGTADTDAVNLGQMNDAIASVQQAADAAVNPFVAAQGNRDTEGAIASGTHATAAGANAVASGANAVALGANTQATGANSVALGADSVADRDNGVSVGSAGNERQITNVAPGTAGTDAANMNQLNAMAAQGQGYVDQRISGVQNQISDVRRDAFGAAAAAMAVAGLPQPTEPGKTMVAAAGSHIGGQTGMALGVSYVTRNNRWVAKASASSSSQGNTGVTLGAGYQW